ncbi:MAG TPA: hypothetical protein VK348_11285, partial [Planctomycetota bacterium]|nr:hypothetical protein [Planctomycetota bacterium]
LAAERLAQKLHDLHIPYAICGGLAVVAHGHERMTGDVDVLLSAEGLRRFKGQALGRGWVDKSPGSRGVRDTVHDVPIHILLTGGHPGDGKPRGVMFPDPATVAVELSGKLYLSLAKLVELKLASGIAVPARMQDLDDVIRLIRKNHLGQDFAGQLHPEVQPKYQELWGYAQRPSDLPE